MNPNSCRNLQEFYFNLHLEVDNFFIRDDRNSHGWARKNRQTAQLLYERKKESGGEYPRLGIFTGLMQTCVQMTLP